MRQNKKRFRMIADCPPPADERSLVLYKESGIDTYVLPEDHIRFEDGRAAYEETLLALGRAELDVFIRGLDHNVFPGYFDKFGDFCFSDFPAVKGFYMIDEPCSGKFDAIREVYGKYYLERYGHMHWHVNLFPSYATEAQMGAYAYGGRTAHENYLDKYVKEVSAYVTGTQSLGIDHYPFRFRKGENVMTDGWLKDLFAAGAAARKADADYSVCIQCFTDGDAWRPLTRSSEVSFQAWVSLAFGATMFEFFIYREVYTSAEGRFIGMVNKDGTTTPYYGYVQDCIRQLRAVEIDYFELDWKGVAVVRGTSGRSDNDELFAGLDGKTRPLPAGVSVEAEEDALIGVFERSGKPVLLAVNFNDPVKDIACTLRIGLAGGGEVRTDGKKRPCGEKTEIALAPGAAAFVYCQ